MHSSYILLTPPNPLYLPMPCLQPTEQQHIFRTLENDPLFARQPGEDVSLERKRELTFRRAKQLFKYNFLTEDELMQNPWKLTVLNDCLGMYDWSVGNKFFLSKGVSYLKTISAVTLLRYQSEV